MVKEVALMLKIKPRKLLKTIKDTNLNIRIDGHYMITAPMLEKIKQIYNETDSNI